MNRPLQGYQKVKLHQNKKEYIQNKRKRFVFHIDTMSFIFQMIQIRFSDY